MAAKKVSYIGLALVLLLFFPSASITLLSSCFGSTYYLGSDRLFSYNLFIDWTKSIGAEGRIKFSFAIISDTHTKGICSIAQGRWIKLAVDIINKKKPDFVIGLGDLVAGGGNCKLIGGPSLYKQLVEFKKVVLEKLRVPFIPISGNHDFQTLLSTSTSYARRTWTKFWNSNQKYILPAARGNFGAISRRFMHKGIGFSLIGYYDTYGLDRKEVDWVNNNVGWRDFVFRHINPYGISCEENVWCGRAIRSYRVRNFEILPEILKRRNARALFSGHTHAFYDGVCKGLRFISTGSLASRSMEYVHGWKNSKYKNKQAFVLVEITEDLSYRVLFYVYNPNTKKMELFNKTNFPAVVKAEKKFRGFFYEGIKARCLSVTN